MLSPLEIVEQRLAESREYEFKRELPGRDDRAKSEVLKDVCALANSGGGFIYYGIEELQGNASRIVPIEGEDFDAASRRIGQVLDAGIEPRLRDIRFQTHDVEGGYVLALRVSPSFNVPHRMIANGHSKFMIRNGTHVAEMSFDQIRQAFQRNGTLIAGARDRWANELVRVRERQTWRPIVAGPVCVAQFLPLSAMEQLQTVDVVRVHENFAAFMYEGWGGASRSFNLDGVVVHPGGRENEAGAFVIVGRDGSVTSYRSAKAVFMEELIIPSQTIAEFFRTSYHKFANFVRDYDIPGPFLTNTAIVGVHGYQLGMERRLMLFDNFTADRNDLIFPEQYFETIFDREDEKIPKTMLDTMWQSFGLSGCNYYDGDGRWAPR